MNKLSFNRTLGWIALVLAIVLAAAWGYIRKDHYESQKATELLNVKHYQWINDDAKLLSDATEKTVSSYNTDWDDKYSTVVAVATLSKLNGWTQADYAKALGEKWGLGAGDMLLLLVKDSDWYVAVGDNVAVSMTDTQQTKLKHAIDQPYYTGNYDEAVAAFFRQADVFYGQTNLGLSGTSDSNSAGEWSEYREPPKPGSVSIFKVVLLVAGLLAVWAIIDRIRYGRYRRRTAVASAPAVSYYPIFWGRPAAPARPAPPPPPPAPHTGYAPRPSQTVYRTNGTYHNPPPRPAAPRPTTASRPASPSRSGGNSPRGGKFGGGGFGGGKH